DAVFAADRFALGTQVTRLTSTNQKLFTGYRNFQSCMTSRHDFQFNLHQTPSRRSFAEPSVHLLDRLPEAPSAAAKNKNKNNAGHQRDSKSCSISTRTRQLIKLSGLI